ncbi:MAG: phosphatase PAP2 family protein [Gammaproteobacteria bacterium]|jgi:undecaprenyl-diphosphatase
MDWLGRYELATLISLVLVVGSIWAFVEIAEEVVEGETHSFDETILLAMRNAKDPADPLGPKWLEELARDFTALGSVGVMTLITVTVSGFLLLQARRRATLLILAAVGGGLLISTLMKQGFDRPRPDLVPHGSYVYTTSFPSGHSMMSAVTYLTLGALLARVQPRRQLKAYLLMIAILLTVLVGITRVYLGVHWPTDVLAGWTAGAAWALICWLAARWLQHRGQMEPDRQMPEQLE